jgi:hypothetical protein
MVPFLLSFGRKHNFWFYFLKILVEFDVQDRKAIVVAGGKGRIFVEPHRTLCEEQ